MRTIWRIWGLCKFTFFVLLPDWHETEDALKNMRSLQVCHCCSVTWLARNGGRFEEYEDSGVYRCPVTKLEWNGGRFWRLQGLSRSSNVVLLPDWHETEDALKSMMSLKVYHCSVTWLARNGGRFAEWGLWRSNIVLFPDWHETGDALKSMRSLEVYRFCSVTWLARNRGCFEEYEVSDQPLLFCYVTIARNGGHFEEYEVPASSVI